MSDNKTLEAIVEVSKRMPEKGIFERMSKLTEEVGEVATALNKGESEQEFIDECADSIIVLMDMVRIVSGENAVEDIDEAIRRKLLRWETKYGDKQK